MGFPRQEYWSGVPFPSLRDLSNAGIDPASPVSPGLQVDSLSTEPLGKPTRAVAWSDTLLGVTLCLE